jgi:hypothetical protein
MSFADAVVHGDTAQTFIPESPFSAPNLCYPSASTLSARAVDGEFFRDSLRHYLPR